MSLLLLDHLITWQFTQLKFHYVESTDKHLEFESYGSL